MSKGLERKGIPLTIKQMARQLLKIKKTLFVDYTEFADGTYKGEMHPDIIKIIEKYMVIETIQYVDFIVIVKKCADEIHQWIHKKVTGVDKRLLTLYVYDFVTQSMDIVYIIKEDKTDDDPMYA